MLVATNKWLKIRNGKSAAPALDDAAQMKQRPRLEVLGRCSQAKPGRREIGISRFRAGEFRPLEVLSDHP